MSLQIVDKNDPRLWFRFLDGTPLCADKILATELGQEAAEGDYYETFE